MEFGYWFIAFCFWLIGLMGTEIREVYIEFQGTASLRILLWVWALGVLGVNKDSDRVFRAF